jgi:hypothetical protein
MGGKWVKSRKSLDRKIAFWIESAYHWLDKHEMNEARDCFETAKGMEEIFGREAQ